MNEQESKIDDITAPRFVFRTFGHKLKKYQEKMELLSILVPEDIQVMIFEEIYIISKTVDNTNIKVKNNKLDVKKLIQTKDNFEQWETIKKQNFPISNQLLINEIFPALNVDSPSFDDDMLSKKQFINIVNRHDNLLAVPVQKQPHAYIVNLSICEFAQVIIGNDYLYSVSVEATDFAEVQKTMNDLNLDSFENINYIQAIKRVNDIISKPLAN
jgi:hypothetical protein